MTGGVLTLAFDESFPEEEDGKVQMKVQPQGAEKRQTFSLNDLNEMRGKLAVLTVPEEDKASAELFLNTVVAMEDIRSTVSRFKSCGSPHFDNFQLKIHFGRRPKLKLVHSLYYSGKLKGSKSLEEDLADVSKMLKKMTQEWQVFAENTRR